MRSPCKQKPERLAKERARYHAKKEAMRAITKAYRDSNRELLRQKGREHWARHRLAINLERSERYAKNRDHINALCRARWAADPSFGKTVNANRSARLAGGRLSRGIVESLLALQRGLCINCRRRLRETGWHVDHVMPLSRGGKNVDDNVQLLCPRCNLKKRATDPIEWAQANGRLL